MGQSVKLVHGDERGSPLPSSPAVPGLNRVSVEFTSGIVEAVREEENGSVSINTLAVAGQAINNQSHFMGLGRF